MMYYIVQINFCNFLESYFFVYFDFAFLQSSLDFFSSEILRNFLRKWKPRPRRHAPQGLFLCMKEGVFLREGFFVQFLQMLILTLAKKFRLATHKEVMRFISSCLKINFQRFIRLKKKQNDSNFSCEMIQTLHST